MLGFQALQGRGVEALPIGEIGTQISVTPPWAAVVCGDIDSNPVNEALTPRGRSRFAIAQLIVRVGNPWAMHRYTVGTLASISLPRFAR